VQKVVAFDFTTCGVSVGPAGPTQAQCTAAYGAGNTLNGAVTVAAGIQQWTVPFTGNYVITAAGAQGGNDPYTVAGGLGAQMTGTFALTAGQVLEIVVGQQGTPVNATGNAANGGAGGGGGSFVWVSGAALPLIAAGGGGGSCLDDSGVAAETGQPGVTTTAGSNATSGTNAGTNGGNSTCQDGGNGWLTVMTNPVGGAPGWNYNSGGGFGGGGGGGYNCGGNYIHTAGGGGGYSGGGGGTVAYEYAGGGGGSYNAGTAQNNQGGVQTGAGQVTITF
jgi:hypothetical protein